jgi:hypothetical protein
MTWSFTNRKGIFQFLASMLYKTKFLELTAGMTAAATTRRQHMRRTPVGKVVRVGVMVAVFASGWFFGTVSQRGAQAQLGQVGKSLMEKAGEQGGPLGAAAKLGTSIEDIQKNLDALQK